MSRLAMDWTKDRHITDEEIDDAERRCLLTLSALRKVRKMREKASRG